MDSRTPKPPPIMKPHAERVWVIGLDGATFRVLDVFAARGWMPNLAQLMREGTSASLRSTLPPISAPAWTSFLTGCNPGKHGVYAFRGPMRGGWERPVSNGSAIRVPRIWQFLGLFGLSSGLINVPMTYPVEPLHGYLVSGMLTPDGNVAAAYPEDVQQMLRAQKYVVDLHIGRRERDLRTEEQVIDLVNDLVATVQGRTRAALQLLKPGLVGPVFFPAFGLQLQERFVDLSHRLGFGLVILRADGLCSLKRHMLEKMGQARDSPDLVDRSDVGVDMERNHRRLMPFEDKEFQPVVQREFRHPLLERRQILGARRHRDGRRQDKEQKCRPYNIDFTFSHFLFHILYSCIIPDCYVLF